MSRNPDELDAWEEQYAAWESERDRMRDGFIEEAQARFIKDHIVSVESYGDEVRFTSSLTKSARPGARYQVTDFEGDEPIGHREYQDLDEALAGLWDVASPQTKRVPPVPNPAPVDPEIVGALVSGEYHGTPFEGRVHSLDVYGHADVDVPVGWTHRGRDYSEGIMTDAESLTIVQPRKLGKVTYANEQWTWTRAGGKPWPRNLRNPASERPAFKYRYLGTNDEESVCGCCGRQDLKRVAWLVALDEEGNEIRQPVPYGTTCAGLLLRDVHHTKGKKKPSKGESEKLLEAARQEAVNEAWDRTSYPSIAQAPEPIVGENKYGVPTITVGETTYIPPYESVRDPSARSPMGMRMFVPPSDLPLQLEIAKNTWRNEERFRRARAEAERMGLLDVQTWEFQKAMTRAVNPREDRLRSRITRV